jgi:hypothetical protein
VQELRRSINYMGCIRKKRRGVEIRMYLEKKRGLMESGNDNYLRIKF